MQLSGYFKKITVYLLSVSCFAWTSVTAAGSLAQLRTASDSARQIVQQALASEESDPLASVFTEDGSVVVPTGQVIRGRTTIGSMAALMMMTWGGGNLQTTPDSLAVRDSTGYEIGRFVFRRQVKNLPDQVWAGGYTAVWQIEKGAWKISRVTGLLNKPSTQTEKPGGK